MGAVFAHLLLMMTLIAGAERIAMMSRQNSNADKNGFIEVLQEFRKEPLPEPVWMLHEAGTILDDTWNPSGEENRE